MANYISKYTGAQIDKAVGDVLNGNVGGTGGGGNITIDDTLTKAGAAADAKATGDRLTALSEEIAGMGGGTGSPGQTTPEAFGAKGDGVTDDAAAIAQALASGQNVVFDGAKTYAVGSTITIPADSFVDFRGATVVPQGNHDVIRVMPGSHISNLIVRCTNVSGWDSAVMVFYGGDMFRADSPTRINNVKMFNDITYNDGVANAGNGVYMYVDAPEQFVEGLAVTDLSTTGFGKGVYIKGLDASVENIGKVAFIGANNFCRYWSFKDTYGIYMASNHKLDRVTSNFFTDMNIQAGGHGNSLYAIYCSGFNNYFSGCIYDYFYMNPNDSIKAIFFGRESNSNVVETTSGVVYEVGFVTDYGQKNRVVKRAYEDTLSIPNASYDIGMIGNQDDILAYADKYMDCTLESLDGDPEYGNLSNVFNPDATKVLSYAEPVSGDSDKMARITINLKKAVREITNIIMQFSRNCVPPKIRVTFYGDTEVRRVYDTTENVNQLVLYNHTMSMYPIADEPVANVAKIVIEIGGFAEPLGGGTKKRWTLQRIMATGNDTTGKTWMRSDGGDVYGNVRFRQGEGVVLTSQNGSKFLLTVSDSGALSTSEYIEPEEEAPEVAALIPTMAAGATWYNTDLAGAAQNTITSVTFDATYEPTGSEDASWACDDESEGLIMAYRNGTNVVITPTTGSDKIRLNLDSTYMFANDGTNANFAALASIAGTEMWVATEKTSMSRVCEKNAALSSPLSIPSGVNNLSYAFSGCTALATPPVLPDGLTGFVSAFSNCSGMQYLPDLPSTVTSLNYAFQGCTAATKAPATIPASVASMTNAFRNCRKIEGTIVVNVGAISSYAKCFENAGFDGSGIVLTGSCPLLAELAATNADGKVTVAS